MLNLIVGLGKIVIMSLSLSFPESIYRVRFWISLYLDMASVVFSSTLPTLELSSNLSCQSKAYGKALNFWKCEGTLINWTQCDPKLSRSCSWEKSDCSSSRAFCYTLQHLRKPNIWLICWVSWEPFVEASGDLWPLSFATGRVLRRFAGLRAVVMATFSLTWGGCSSILLARVDPLAVSLQLILLTTSHRQGRARQGAASRCKKTDLLSPTWSLSHRSVEKE